ncbi:glycosyltransferase family 4 protein [Candidatus Berkelbacteria bacterium]|nr:glycosyltransferase family 4 protein [Candidatus Berkelbacteria bacterium]
MKVLIIAPFFFERHRWMMSAYKTALNLSKKMQVVVLTTGSPQYETISPNLKIYRMWDLFLPDPINYSIVPGLIPNLEKIIHREQPDIFLVNKHMFFTSLAILWLRLRGKKVICATDTFPGLNWFPKNKLVRIVMKAYSKLIGIPLLKLSNKVILFHEGLKIFGDQLKLNYQIIHNGVDLEKIDKAKISHEFDRTKTNVIYVGRLETIKGYYDLIETAQQLSRERPDIVFYLVGNLSGKQELKEKCESSNIKFLGFRKDIPSLLKAADIFVLPSYSEGLPNALMEAMAAGCASLASNVGGIKILLDKEKNGLLFTPGNITELSAKIIKLADNRPLRRDLARAARRKIETAFSWATITEQYLKLFRELTND